MNKENHFKMVFILNINKVPLIYLQHSINSHSTVVSFKFYIHHFLKMFKFQIYTF